MDIQIDGAFKQMLGEQAFELALLRSQVKYLAAENEELKKQLSKEEKEEK